MRNMLAIEVLAIILVGGYFMTHQACGTKRVNTQIEREVQLEKALHNYCEPMEWSEPVCQAQLSQGFADTRRSN